jgi:polar amino acid transport system permease protein
VATTVPPPDQVGSDLVTTPVSVARRVSPVRTRLAASIVMLVFAVLIVAVLWLSLLYFRASLHIGTMARNIWTVVLGVIGAAAAILVLFGFKAVGSSLTARRLAAEGRKAEARIKAEDAREWIWWVAGLGTVLAVLSFIFWFLATDDGVIRKTFLNGDILGATWESILRGFWLNVKIFMVAEVLVLIWSLVVALGRTFPGRAGAPVRFLATAYCDIFRGFPAILTLFLVVFGLQLADPPLVSALSREQKVFWLPVFALVLVYGAYVAEVYRSGLESIHWSQTAAARSLGLSGPQTMRYVVVPQAVRRIIPPLLNDFIGLQKDTALLSFVGTFEAFNVAGSAANRYFNQSPVLGAGLCFLVITIPLARFTDWLVKRDATRMRANG